MKAPGGLGKSLLQTGAWVLSSQWIANLCIFALNLAILKFWSPSVHGQYIVLLSIANLLVFVSDFGIAGKLGVRDLAASADDSERSHALTKAFFALLPISSLCILAPAFLHPLLEKQLALQSGAWPHLCLWIAAGVVARFCSMVALGLNHGKLLLALTAFNQPLWLLGVVFAHFSGRFPAGSLISILSAMSVLSLVLCPLSVHAVLKKTGVRIGRPAFGWIGYWKEGAWFYLPFLFTAGFPSFTLLVAGWNRLPPADLSVIQISLQIGLIMRLLFQPLSVSLFPHFARLNKIGNGRDGILPVLSLLAHGLSLLFFGYGLFLFYASDTLFRALYASPVPYWILAAILGAITLDSMKNVYDQQILNSDRKSWITLYESLKFPLFALPFLFLGRNNPLHFYALSFLAAHAFQILMRGFFFLSAPSVLISLAWLLASVALLVAAACFPASALALAGIFVLGSALQLWVFPYLKSDLALIFRN